MKNIAVEYPAPGQIQLVEIEKAPDPGPGEVVLETQHSGITNGTERHALLGEHVWKGCFPSRHGYQHVGRIAKVGKDVKDFQEGDYVFNGRYVGHLGWHQYEVASVDARARNSHLTVKLPEGFNPEYAALLGVAGVALRGVRRFRVGAGSRVWVAGAGLIGQFSAQSARALGAHVTVSDVNPDRLARAKACGAHRIVDAREPDSKQRLIDGGPYTCIIDCCGLPSFLRDLEGTGMVAHRTVIGLMAVHTETTFHWGLLHVPEASIEVACHFSIDDLEALIHLIGSGAIRVEELITHRARIEDAVRVYSTLRDSPGEMLGAVFDWTK